MPTDELQHEIPGPGEGWDYEGQIARLSHSIKSRLFFPDLATADQWVIDNPTYAVDGLTAWITADATSRVLIGGAWQAVGAASGGYDSGWQDIAIASGYASSGQAVGYRVRDGVVYWRGAVQVDGGGAWPASSVLTVASGITSAAQPDTQSEAERQLSANSAHLSVRGYVTTAGDMRIITGPDAPTSYVQVSGLSGYLVAGV